jgi:hypothetical protein
LGHYSRSIQAHLDVFQENHALAQSPSPRSVSKYGFSTVSLGGIFQQR